MANSIERVRVIEANAPALYFPAWGDRVSDGLIARSVLAHPGRCEGAASEALASLARAGRSRELSLTAERP
jgi:hypothetical protein